MLVAAPIWLLSIILHLLAMKTATLPSAVTVRWLITCLLMCGMAGPALAGGGNGGDGEPPACDCAQLLTEMSLLDQEEQGVIELRRENRPMHNLLQAFHNAMNYLYQSAMPDQVALASQRERERERCREHCRQQWQR